jgi:hypothetical protein
MTEPTGMIERALREGPPDERGYRFQRLALPEGYASPNVHDVDVRGSTRGRSSPGPRAMWAGPSLAAVLILVMGLGGFALLTRQGGPSSVTPDVSATPSASPTPTASPRPSSSTTASPTPSPPPVASESAIPDMSPIAVPPLTERFVSTRNGFSVLYPAGWATTPATESWPVDMFLPIGHPALDQLMLAGKVRLIAASQALSVGQTESDWVASYFYAYPSANSCVTSLADSPRFPVDGKSGYLDSDGCPSSADYAVSPRDVVYEAFVFAGDRVYQFYLDGDVDLAYFEAIMATVKLDPATALDPPPAP